MKKLLSALLIIIFVFIIMSGCDTISSLVEDIDGSLSGLVINSTASEENLSMTMGQKNALRSAKTYLKTMPFSKTGLIKQLEFEGYSTEDASFAADNCGADWKEQAVKKAKSYLDIMAFSKEGLIKQLEFEGFTNEEAVYGATANGY